MKFAFHLHLIWIVSATVFLTLAGCTSAPKPPVAQISLNVQGNINPAKDGTARPVAIRIYELKSDTAFNTSGYFSVFNDYKATLDSEYLDSEKIQLVPNMKRKFDKPLHIDTRYVGVVSAFRDLEHSQWRAAAALPSKESKPEIYILLDGTNVKIGAKQPCGFFCQLWSPKAPVGSLYEIIENQAD